MEIKKILLKYWGYASFRPMQEDIIRSVLTGNDTLALLPTGGGKSLCYQIPALAKEGMCLVVSPLIALMKDQVDHLRKSGISAAAVYSGMHPDEINIILSNARNGMYKLLYCSPERLTTTTMRETIKRLKVNLLAVDEAHCISQWGYDFRPPYLKIAEIRAFLAGVPVLALTATATPAVVKDIMTKLQFKKELVLRKSFERKNLTYVVIREEDKKKRLLRVISRINGPGIIYVRNRKETREIAEFLEKNKISASFYHAGLDHKTRDQRQQAWIDEKKRIIVATNAFGMGIDKSNVRCVIHMDLPDCIEAYFQEAGRAGRDEKKSWAILLYEEADSINAKNNLSLSYPEPATIRTVYQALGNYFQIPVGSGCDLSLDFDLSLFSEQYKFQPLIVYNALKLLEKEGYIILTESFHNPSRVFIKADKEELYQFQVSSPFYDRFLKYLLRSYSGILSGFVRISETELSKRLDLKTEEVRSHLKRLEKLKILDYIPQTNKPQLIFPEERLDPKDLLLTPEHYRDRLVDATSRLEAMLRYVNTGNVCRSIQLLSYFGEYNSKRCGSCDVCLERNKLHLNDLEFNTIVEQIKPFLQSKCRSMEEIVNLVHGVQEDKIILAIQWLLDNKQIIQSENQKLHWK
jgi:ATP-dependent DNA helicase RecQ